MVFFISHLRLESLLGRLNQQSSENVRGYKKCFIFNLISIHLGVQGLIRNFTLGQHPSQNITIFFWKKFKQFFQGNIFLYYAWD